jgi:hypothetical protein
MTDIREFMTGWFTQGDNYSGPTIEKGHMMAWSERRKTGLRGKARGKHFVPKFRPFDMLCEPNQTVLLLTNEDQRLGVESVVGCQGIFKRNIDFDEVIFQFAGHSTIETECGEFQMGPGELILIPEGIAQRSTGTADCLRMFARLHEPVQRMWTPEQHVSHTEFEMTRTGGPDWTVPAGAEIAPKGDVIEHMVTWRDKSPDDYTIVEREYDALVGASSTQRDVKESSVRKIRAFDFFTEITGQRGPGPKLIETPNFIIEVYNTTGEQFAFHRALRSEEVGLQFRGDSTNMSEFDGELSVIPGDAAVLPLGIAHSVICEEDFLRIVWYSRIPWDVAVNPAAHRYESTFEAKTDIIEEAEWRSVAAE